MNEATISFIFELGCKISEYSGDPFDSRYFFQRVSMLMQRYTSILFHKAFPAKDEIDSLVLVFSVFNHFYYLRWNNNNNNKTLQSSAHYVDRAATDAGTVADMVATRKTEKYSTLSSAYKFEPIAVESIWHLQFHNSELYFRTRPPNLCSQLHTGDVRDYNAFL